MHRINNFVDGDPNDSTNMIETPDDSPDQSPSETGGKKSLLPKVNPLGGKFESVANSESILNGRISDLHS